MPLASAEPRLRELRVELGARSYALQIGPGLLADPSRFDNFRGRNCRIVTDANVAPLYLEQLLQTLSLAAERAFILPAGETQKTLGNAEAVLDWLLANRFPRDGVLIALGGGVIGDLTGFVASIYQRGVDFLQLPTTLLAQVDSSVGGKTGVNHARGKNMIGAFHQPCAVIADTATLRSLPPRELSAGLAEIIKCGLLADAEFFAWLEQHIDALRALDGERLGAAIERCCRLKAQIVAHDERESIAGGPRALLNLGHTFGHAVETFTHYQTWLHGEAVGLGLCMAADLSTRLGWIDADALARCTALVARAGLPVRPPVEMRVEDFRQLMQLDKKVAAGKLRLVLLRGLGDAVTTADFDDASFAQTLAAFCGPAAAI